MINFIIAVLLLLSPRAFSATQATLLLKGTVPQVLSVEITPESVAQNLDLSTTTTNLKVGEIREKSNLPGYKISAKSVNGGKLVNGMEFVTYSIRYAGNSTSLTQVDQDVRTSTSRGVTDSDVEISYTGVAPELLTPGDYTDTITFTIQVN